MVAELIGKQPIGVVDGHGLAALLSMLGKWIKPGFKFMYCIAAEADVIGIAKNAAAKMSHLR